MRGQRGRCAGQEAWPCRRGCAEGPRGRGPGPAGRPAPGPGADVALCCVCRSLRSPPTLGGRDALPRAGFAHARAGARVPPPPAAPAPAPGLRHTSAHGGARFRGPTEPQPSHPAPPTDQHGCVPSRVPGSSPEPSQTGPRHPRERRRLRAEVVPGPCVQLPSEPGHPSAVSPGRRLPGGRPRAPRGACAARTARTSHVRWGTTSVKSESPLVETPLSLITGGNDGG